MPGFLYRVKDHEPTVPTFEMLAELGIAYAFEKLPEAAEFEQDLLLYDKEQLKPFVPQVRPGEQLWCDVNKRVSVGMYKDGKPAPSDLIRKDVIRGDILPLGGEPWCIPLVRQFQIDGGYATELKQYRRFVDGKWTTGDVVEDHAHLLELVLPFYETWYEAFSLVEFSEKYFCCETEDLCESAVKIIQANYRLGDAEASMLQLFTTDNEAAMVLCWAADIYEARKALKKKPGTSGAASIDGAAA